MKKCILLFIICNLLSGCWDEKILEDLALLTVIAIDIEENNNIILSASYPEFSIGAKEEESIIGITAESTGQGKHKLSRLTDKLVVSGQIQAVLIGEEFAKVGIEKALDTLQRDVETSSTLLVCITEGKASEFLKKAFDDKPLDGLYISKLIKKQERNNELPATSLHEFYNDLYSKHTDGILPYLRLKEKEIIAAETAVFVDDKFVSVLNTDETQILVMLRNDGTSSRFTLEVEPNVFATIAFVDSNTEVITKNINDQLHFDVNLQMTSELVEYEGREDIHSDKKFKELSKKFEEHLNKISVEMVTRNQKLYGTDPIGLGEYARSHFPKEITLEQWREKFKESNLNIKVTLQVVRDGDFR